MAALKDQKTDIPAIVLAPIPCEAHFPSAWLLQVLQQPVMVNLLELRMGQMRYGV